MNALLICPADRPTVSGLADATPLALVPLFGKAFVEYWLEYLVSLGVHHVAITASDRPDQLRTAVGDGARWGLKIDVIPETRELSVEEARAKSHSLLVGHNLDLVLVMEHLPGRPLLRLFDSYAEWFSALQAWQPRALTSDRIGYREVKPGVWLGLHSRVAPTAHLHAPCWIGTDVSIASHAEIGPQAVIEDGAVVETGACVRRSVVGAKTFVGQFTLVQESIAFGNLLINWRTGSLLEVPDEFLLGSLEPRDNFVPAATWFGRILALAAMAVTLPLALTAVVKSTLRDEPILRRRRAVRPRLTSLPMGSNTLVYYELRGVEGWLRRWPQLWNIVRGDFTWIGNRPLSPAAALTLTSEFERLWLVAPVGLISLSDAEHSGENVGSETCAHASFFAVRANFRLKCSILLRALLRAASSKILWQDRADHSSVSLRPEMLKPQG